MQLAAKLLDALCAEKRVDKEKMCLGLNTDLAEVDKAIELLAELGVELAQDERCYILTGEADLLNETQIRKILPEHANTSLLALNVVRLVESTNTLAMEAAHEQEGLAVWCAELQASGRGRRGRQWVSPFASNIYLSLLWRFYGQAEDLGALSLAVGVVLADYFTELGVKGVGLKWPNDILVEGRKLGGILIELQTMPRGYLAVVIGVGINVSMDEKHTTVIDQPWVCLDSLLAKPITRNEAHAGVLNKLIDMLDLFQSDGFGAFAQSWMHYDLCEGRLVVLSGGCEPITGIAHGVASDGALVLECDGVRRHYHGGEVSMRITQ